MLVVLAKPYYYKMLISTQLKLLHIHIVFLLIIPNIASFAISRLAERTGTSIYSNTQDIDSLLAIENTAAVDFSYTVEITKDSNDWINLASQHLDENGVCVPMINLSHVSQPETVKAQKMRQFHI